MRERPFQAALALSLLLHLLLLAFLRAGGVGAEPSRTARVRLIRLAPVPAAAPQAPPSPDPAPRPDARVPAPPALAPRVPAPEPDASAPDRRGAAVPPAPVESLPESTAAPAEDRAPVGPAVMTEEAVAPAGETPAAPARGGDAVAPDPVATPRPEPARGVDTVAGRTEGASGSAAASGTAAEPTAAAIPEQVPQAAVDEAPVRTAALLAQLQRQIDARKWYPVLAVRNGWEGDVLVELYLGSGRLEQVRVLRGSGHTILDEATLVAVRRAAPYPPIEGRVTVPVEYRLGTP